MKHAYLSVCVLGFGILMSVAVGRTNFPTSDSSSATLSPLSSGYTAWQAILTPNPTDPPSSYLQDKTCCFAPDTDPDYVARLSRRFYGDFDNPLNYIIANRWTNTANGSAGGQGDPVTLTYSFVPDGVEVPDQPPPNGFGDQTNNIYALMNGQAGFPNEAFWKGLFADAFNYWSDMTGITFVETVDDGATLYDPVTNSGHSPGVLGVRGDIRIAACPMDGSSGVLAYNRYPDYADMVLDNAENWDNTSYSYGFLKNIVAHELGHAIGIAHVCPNGCTILMDPYLCSSIGGPQHDDLRAGQRNYGDRNENNNSSGQATDLGFLNDETSFMLNVSSDDNNDIDWYEFTVDANKQAAVLLDIVGSTYQNCAQTEACTCTGTINSLDDANLSLYLYDTDAATILASATSEPAGVDEFIDAVGLPSAGTYYVRVSSDNSNAVQMYNLNVFVEPNTVATVDVTSPNGGESWMDEEVHPITWTSSMVTGNVTIELNRDYPGGSWETLFASTANDGTQNWTVTGAASTNARVRITSINEPSATDVSNASFTIVIPEITITRPNGGESLNGDASEVIQWSSLDVTGNILIELNRSYPGGAWENIATVPNAGASIAFGGPPTTAARMRLTSVNEPSAVDISDGDFEIFILDDPPVITHDEHGDAAAGAVTFTAIVTDDNSVPETKVFHQRDGSADFDSSAMSATGNPNEFAAVLGFGDGRYHYFLRAMDGIAQYASTDTFTFDAGGCADTLSLDDGTAEGFNWAQEVEYSWAVKVDPGNYPYQLCGITAAIARISPDEAHSPILARVLDSDGIAGLPGTVLWSEPSGSIGNEIGGLTPGTLHWATVLVDSGDGTPLILNAPFYLAVSNPVSGKYEAFGRDDDTPTANMSFFYEGCDLEWLSESDAHPNARGGTRMIRALGFSLADPSALVIVPAGVDITLYWSDSGAPYYRIYSSLSSDGPFGTLEGSTASTTFVDTGAISGADIKFYQIVGSTTP